MRHHVLIRDEAEPTLYRRIEPEDKSRLEVCFDGDLYRLGRDPDPRICLPGPEGERLCDFDQPHDHSAVMVAE
jgi:hypothetical protein